jgi:hypothetical protein
MTWYDRRCNRWRGMENEDSLLDMIALQLAMMSTFRERERERERDLGRRCKEEGIFVGRVGLLSCWVNKADI